MKFHQEPQRGLAIANGVTTVREKSPTADKKE